MPTLNDLKYYLSSGIFFMFLGLIRKDFNIDFKTGVAMFILGVYVGVALKSYIDERKYSYPFWSIFALLCGIIFGLLNDGVTFIYIVGAITAGVATKWIIERKWQFHSLLYQAATMGMEFEMSKSATAFREGFIVGVFTAGINSFAGKFFLGELVPILGETLGFPAFMLMKSRAETPISEEFPVECIDY